MSTSLPEPLAKAGFTPEQKEYLTGLFAGVAARAAPQIGGLLMTSPLVSLSVGIALVAGAGSLFEDFGWIVKASLANLAPH